MTSTTHPTATSVVDAVVIGAGFSGLYMLKRLRDEQGMNVRVIEKGHDVGGTWFWNRYPGARCDAPSVDYSYSFDPQLDQDWTWSERFATQPEILSYLQHVADRYDLRRDITFNATVTGATFNEETNTWSVTVGGGDHTEVIEATYLITAVGCLSASQIPDFPGRDDFRGETYHTGQWPHEGVDFTGQRVAIIGTGSSAVQTIPLVAQEAERLFVLQRTPGFEIPARNRPHTADEMAEIKARYPQLRKANRATASGMFMPPPIGAGPDFTDDEVRAELELRWAIGGPAIGNTFNDQMVSAETNAKVADFYRDKVRETVEDPEVAEKLIPADFPVGAKRLCIGTDYYETFNRDNVELVSVKDQPIQKITERGILIGEGTDARELEVDAIIFATGYDAMTGPYTRMDIRGRAGESISEHWAGGPTTYLGISVAGFPNFFMITAPGSPSVLTNMPAAIEQHVDWLADYIADLRENGIAVTEPTLEAEEKWVAHVNGIAEGTLYVRGGSWYLGTNIPGKPRVFTPYAGGLDAYREHCAQVAADGYPGFTQSRRQVRVDA